MLIRLKGDENLVPVDYRKVPTSKPIYFKYGQDLPVDIEFYHDDGSAFLETELSCYASFQFGIDNDYDFSTNPAALTTSGFTVSGNKLSFSLLTDSEKFKTILDDSPSAGAKAELKAYIAGNNRPKISPSFSVTLLNAVIADGTQEPPSSPELYVTAAELAALLDAYSKCYPADGPLTFTQADIDSETKLLSVPHGLGQQWGLSVSVGSEALGEQIRLDRIIPVDDDNLNIDCTEWYDDMTGNYYLRVRK